MEIDYKHYRYQRPWEKRKKRRRRFILGIILIFLILFFTWDQVSLSYLKKGKRLTWEEKYDQAEKKLFTALTLGRRKAKIYDALLINSLFQKNKQKALNYSKKALHHNIKKSAFDFEQVFEKFIRKGEYQLAEIYSDYLEKWNKSPFVKFYQTSAYIGEHKLIQAEKNLQNYPPEVLKRFSQVVNYQKKILNKLKKEKRFFFISDRANIPLIVKKIPTGEFIFPEPIFFSGDFESLPPSDLKNHIILTLDFDIQSAAIKALGRYNGAIVAIRPQTGEILAAVSKSSDDEKSSFLNSCFEKFYEPGSIIKILTAVAYLKEEITDIFPFQCQGWQEIEGKIFYDWIIHHRVNNLSQALIVSCNVCLANIGLKLGWQKMEEVFNDFLFNHKIELEITPVSLGILPPSQNNLLSLARLSVGLNELKITPFHAALIAGVIANQGKLMKPYLIREKRNIFGIPYFKNFPKELQTIVSSRINTQIVQTMIEVVENEQGTGRRARLEGLKLALKTGTAGEKEKGYNSILIGFAPGFNPQIAFSIFAEHAGRAELEGAKITKKFLEEIADKL
ncbi:MAG: penicillin-binding transpeptidase domain-containing protein [Candidatus Aminicenantia bacterium]